MQSDVLMCGVLWVVFGAMALSDLFPGRQPRTTSRHSLNDIRIAFAFRRALNQMSGTKCCAVGKSCSALASTKYELPGMEYSIPSTKSPIRDCFSGRADCSWRMQKLWTVTSWEQSTSNVWPSIKSW